MHLVGAPMGLSCLCGSRSEPPEGQSICDCLLPLGTCLQHATLHRVKLCLQGSVTTMQSAWQVSKPAMHQQMICRTPQHGQPWETTSAHLLQPVLLRMGAPALRLSLASRWDCTTPCASADVSHLCERLSYQQMLELSTSPGEGGLHLSQILPGPCLWAYAGAPQRLCSAACQC